MVSPIGPPYYNRLPSIYTPLVFRNAAFWDKQDLVDWVAANKDNIQLRPPKDNVNAYIVFYLHVTRFVDKRFPSLIFLRAFESEIVTTEDPPTTPWFDRLRSKLAALSALSAQSPCVLTHRKAAAAISAASAPLAEPSIAEFNSQSFDLDDIGPPSPPRIPAFHNGRKTFISRRDVANEDATNLSDDEDENSSMEGPPTKKSKPTQDDFQEGDGSGNSGPSDSEPADGTQHHRQQDGGDGSIDNGSTDEDNGSDGSGSEDDGYEEVKQGVSTFLSFFFGDMTFIQSLIGLTLPFISKFCCTLSFLQDITNVCKVIRETIVKFDRGESALPHRSLHFIKSY
jgi:hypothetical protein